MSIKKYFLKQGGFSLIKQYWRSGSLFTAVAEFVLLGKDRTALEILRLSADFKTKKKLEKKYKKQISELEEQYDITLPRHQSNKIWVCWFQGIENAPELVKICYKSLQKNLPTKEIVLITEDNMKEYIDFPDFILDKWKQGKITHTHMTDLLRIELLLKYGGTWIDATVLCTSKECDIPKYFFESDLFVYQALKPGKDGVAAFISSWYMSACTNNKILWITRELCYEYWKNNNSMVDYFLLHDFMCLVLEKEEREWMDIIPRDNATPHILLLRMFEKYDREMFQSIVSQTPFHKLSYKFSEKQKLLEETNYKKIISGEYNEK